MWSLAFVVVCEKGLLLLLLVSDMAKDDCRECPLMVKFPVGRGCLIELRVGGGRGEECWEDDDAIVLSCHVEHVAMYVFPK